MECPVALDAALSQLGEVTLDLAMKLPEAERCSLVQRLQADGGSEGTPADSQGDESLSGQVLMSFFGLFVSLLVLRFLNLLRLERGRYVRLRADGQGTFKQYLKYRFGYWYTWTPGSAGIVLLSMSLCLLVSGGVLLRIILQQPLSEGLWSAWLWIAAPDGGGSADTPLGRVIGLTVSVGGMLVFALLLSVISTTFEEMLQGLREGIGPVIEGNHIVILGHLTPMLQIIAKELCNANESEGGTLITILSPLPKPEVEEYLREADGDIKEWMRNSTVVVRSGDSCKAEDLAKVAVQGAKKVIIMSKPGIPREEADALTVNVLLTLRNNDWPRNGHCVVQCQLVRNQGLFKRLLKDKCKVLTANDFIGELMVQCSKKSGLVHVVRSVFSFEGSEFYMQTIQGTAGRRFMDVMFALPGVVLVGVRSPGCDFEMLPDMERIIREGDELCVLAEDDSTVPKRATSATWLDTNGAARGPVVQRSAEVVEEGQTVLIIGWNDSMGAILGEVDNNVGRNSEVIIHSPQPAATRAAFVEAAQKRRNHTYQNFTIRHNQGPLGARFRLEELPLEKASIILVLADESFPDASMADSQTMAVIVQVQDILHERCGPEGSSAVIMPQLLDTSTEETLMQTGIHDYIMSSRLAARIMAVVCEVPQVTCILDCLVKTKVCKFCIAKLEDYPAAAGLDLSEGISFNEAAWLAARSNEVALGWSEPWAGEAGPWDMNPNDRDTKRAWGATARLVVLKRTAAYHSEELTTTGPRTASVALTDNEERRVRQRATTY
eukprot:TRINITY_DN8441_c0_g1_i2.p1 TRINITY_DN8441_c0_g1~~TRINITY_DN8441_c0_g1_i2.p1  ORF type:complete len:799 (-),score=153.55 TRINITY_DN8441_c0_g1_i2:10-2340(-)